MMYNRSDTECKLETFPLYWLFCISPCRPFAKFICTPYKFWVENMDS